MRRISVLFGWSALAIIALGSLFNGNSVVILTPVGITAWLLGAVPAIIVALALLPWAQGLRNLWQQAGWVIIAFLALTIWGATRAFGFTVCVTHRDGEPWPVCYPSWVGWIPVLQGAVTMLLAFTVVAAVPRRQLWRWQIALASVVVLMTAIGLVRALFHPRGFNRLGTGLGGAAVLSTALIVTVVILVAAALKTNRRAWPLWGLAVIGAAEIFLTFSRAGLGLLALATVVLIVIWRKRTERSVSSRAVLLGLGAVVLLAIGAAASFPHRATRLLTLGDPARLENITNALEHWTSSATTILLGTGTAGVWPWFGIDAKLIYAPRTGMMRVEGIEGDLLANPHSTFLGVLVELGLVGIALLTVVLIILVRAALRHQGDRRTASVLWIVVLAAAAFAVDTYLFRNPGVSFVWWCAVFAGLALHGKASGTADDRITGGQRHSN
ncbi:O-antigen ligase family protein [Tessaracoccus sp. Z1128]